MTPTIALIILSLLAGLSAGHWAGVRKGIAYSERTCAFCGDPVEECGCVVIRDGDE